MKIIITKDYEELSAKAAKVMLEAVKNNPYAVLGLATGTTPLGLYAHMIADHEKHGTSYAHIRTVNLDEYKGLVYITSTRLIAICVFRGEIGAFFG